MPRTKRIIDLLLASIGLLLLWPLMLLIAGLVRLEDGGPAIFIQERIGKDGIAFQIYKFRSMRPAGRGRPITVAGDRRITRVGGILRRSKLDELPQLANVLRGEMSLVGPRPEVRRYVELYTADQRLLLRLRPGITDPASIAFLDEERILAAAPDPERAYVQTIMPEKIRLNLAYAERATPWSDLLVIATTLRSLVRRSSRQGQVAWS
ncbi:sugar transferase [Geminicoccus roseus]|uniref:sugar transferase n=1 Tax=Geminicoccus roseus TaxID=404900 RepID=UPI000414290A|nr:sugar transferase [Geminicoccus roseus]